MAITMPRPAFISVHDSCAQTAAYNPACSISPYLLDVADANSKISERYMPFFPLRNTRAILERSLDSIHKSLSCIGRIYSWLHIHHVVIRPLMWLASRLAFTDLCRRGCFVSCARHRPIPSVCTPWRGTGRIPLQSALNIRPWLSDQKTQTNPRTTWI